MAVHSGEAVTQAGGNQDAMVFVFNADLSSSMSDFTIGCEMCEDVW